MELDQIQLFNPTSREEDPRFLQEQLVTYIGNKRSLLPFIGKALDIVLTRMGKEKLVCLDLFSGTGVVARYLKKYSSRLIVNDLERYSEITNSCFLSNRSEIPTEELRDTLHLLERTIETMWEPGFICDLYAPKDEAAIRPDERVFYTRRNATYIDSTRRAIDTLPVALQKYFLAPLIAGASVNANTSGVFKGFYKNAAGIGQFGGDARDALTRILRDIKIELPNFSRFECDYEVHRSDANTLVQTLQDIDVAYFDPPYNQHPYGSNYFMLNLIASYEPPTEISRVSGIPKGWNRSRYNQRDDAASALFHAIEKCPARFVLISYNSEGFIKEHEFIDRLQKCGKLTCLETKYNTFRGSRNLQDRSIHVTEFLYLVEK